MTLWSNGELVRASPEKRCLPIAPVAELVDATDSKSVVRKDVPVRVGPGAPFLYLMAIRAARGLLFRCPVGHCGVSGIYVLPIADDAMGSQTIDDLCDGGRIVDVTA